MRRSESTHSDRARLEWGTERDEAQEHERRHAEERLMVTRGSW